MTATLYIDDDIDVLIIDGKHIDLRLGYDCPVTPSPLCIQPTIDPVLKRVKAETFDIPSQYTSITPLSSIAATPSSPLVAVARLPIYDGPHIELPVNEAVQHLLTMMKTAHTNGMSPQSRPIFFLFPPEIHTLEERQIFVESAIRDAVRELMISLRSLPRVNVDYLEATVRDYHIERHNKWAHLCHRCANGNVAISLLPAHGDMARCRYQNALNATCKELMSPLDLQLCDEHVAELLVRCYTLQIMQMITDSQADQVTYAELRDRMWYLRTTFNQCGICLYCCVRFSPTDVPSALSRIERSRAPMRADAVRSMQPRISALQELRALQMENNQLRAQLNLPPRVRQFERGPYDLGALNSSAVTSPEIELQRQRWEETGAQNLTTYAALKQRDPELLKERQIVQRARQKRRFVDPRLADQEELEPPSTPVAAATAPKAPRAKKQTAVQSNKPRGRPPAAAQDRLKKALKPLK